MAITLVVEDGTGVANANTYIDVTFADSYFADRGIADWAAAGAEPKKAALVRATDFLDAKFHYLYSGWRKNAVQARDWPRVGAQWDVEYIWGDTTIADNSVPVQVKQACCEAAIRSLRAGGGTAAGDLLVDVPAGLAGAVIEKTVGPITTRWASSSAGSNDGQTIYELLERILAPVLTTNSKTGHLARS